MTEEQAKQLYKSEFWKEMSYRERATFQLYERRLCMPFSIFHEAIEKTLNRPVFTHEFVDVESLKRELLGEKKRPTFEEILDLIPEDKRIIVIA